MRFELIGWHKAKLTKVSPFAKKLGQKDLRPAVALRFMVTVANDVLDKFSPGMREFLYEKSKSAPAAKQKQLEGVAPVSELPDLREPGVKLGALHWDDEQTGCTLRTDYGGAGGPNNIKLKDCRIYKFKIAAKDGGTVQVFFTCEAIDIDADTMGILGVMHAHDMQIELTAPEPISAVQKGLDEPQTPLGNMVESQRAIDAIKNKGGDKKGDKPAGKK